jgi:hypothetical protein
MLRIVLALLAFAACQRTREVTLQLGPTPDTITLGFVCRQDADPSLFLAERARVGPNFEFNVIVDIIDLGGQLPGCRGEELVAACPSGTCSIVPRASGRYCQRVSFAASLVNPDDLKPLLEAVRTQLDDELVTLDAPDRPVLIRALATTEGDCGDVPDTFDPDQLVGCAYSCPVQLDAIDGPIALSLDALSNTCEPEVRACARYP